MSQIMIQKSIPHIHPYIKKKRKKKKKKEIEDIGGARGTRCVMNTQTDRMTQRMTGVISIVLSRLHRVTNRKNSYTAFNHL